MSSISIQFHSDQCICLSLFIRLFSMYTQSSSWLGYLLTRLVGQNIYLLVPKWQINTFILNPTEDRTGWPRTNALYLYLRGALLDSRSEHRLSYWCFACFSSVLHKSQDSTSNMPRPLPSKSFPIVIHLSPYDPTLYDLGSGKVNCCWSRQHSHSCFQVPRDSWPYFIVSRLWDSCNSLTRYWMRR
jgi:hypothetical protein